jgi:hypothetical protein
LTAVSAIVFFLGLLFGFQRPSRLLPPRLRATVLLLLGCTPFNFGAAFFISKRFLCQAAIAVCLHRFISLGISIAPLRIASSYRGARNLLRIRVSCQLASSTLSSTSFRLPPFRGAAASTTTALGVNFARRLRISSFVFHCFSRRPPSPVRLRLSVRGGAASIAPPWVASTAHFSRLIPLAVRFFQPYWRGPQDL